MREARQAAEYAAEALGFSALGVARADAPQGDTLKRWIERGCHAGMNWLERHLPVRLNPQLVLPGARSVIILTYEYPRSDARQQRGTIARYAQGEDYHKLLSSKLADLDETLSFYGGNQVCFSDSGPISERFFAAQAGLGWIGRNGLLVRPRGGSYCFLCSILTTLELPTDSPMPNRCGSCRRCEKACPTGALHEGSCDARRCLSYWTIEARKEEGEPPPNIRKALMERIFGCDACQESCPWNSLPPTRKVDPHLLMPARLAQATLGELELLEGEPWQRFFAGSSIRRAGERLLRRTVRTIRGDSEAATSSALNKQNP